MESLVHQDSDMKELTHENVENERNRTSVTWEPAEGGRQGKEDTHGRRSVTREAGVPGVCAL